MKKIFLVGNPNTGKTTLFNSLTRSQEHTGNWHGVTVDKTEKVFKFEKHDYCLVDLPGIYSLNPLSGEEHFTVKQLFSEEHDLILFACDKRFLRKNLYLLTELLLAGKTNIIVAVNNLGVSFGKNFNNIETHLNVPILECDFADKSDVEKLKRTIKNFKSKEGKSSYNIIFSKNTNDEINYLSKKFNLEKFEIIKIIEKNNYFLNKINKNNFIFNFFNKYNNLTLESLIKEKYNFIDKICLGNLSSKESFLDKIFLNKFLAIPTFLLIMLCIFYLTFFGLGAFLSDVLEGDLQNIIVQPVCAWLERVCGEGWLVSLVRDGIFAGALGLCAFLPQVVMLFLCLAIMEETGYFARVAFVFEDIFSKIGLSGKSVYTLLMGFGCSASAILSTRALEGRNVRIKTALATPFMSCSAKLPLYAALGGAFFGLGNVWVVFGLYILGVFVGVLVSCFLDKFLPTKNSMFFMEFPPLMCPKPKKILQVTFENMRLFLIKVATIFVSMSVVIWCLSNFSFSQGYVQGGQGSILEAIGMFFAPIFAPLGFDSWGAVGALVCGLVAKEVVVSSIAIFNGVAEGQGFRESLYNPLSPVHFSAGSMTAFLTFCLLYTPCIATIAVLKKEIGWKWTILAVIGQLVIAWGMSFIVFNIFKLSQIIGSGALVLGTLGLIIVLCAFTGVYRFLTKKDKCAMCGKCKF